MLEVRPSWMVNEATTDGKQVQPLPQQREFFANAQPQLGIFSGDDSSDVPCADQQRPPDLWPGMTLTEFFDAYVLPDCLTDAAEGTIKEYRQTLKYWRAFTGNPPLSSIDRHTIRVFRDELKQLPGRRKGETIAENSIHKHCVNVQFVLDRAGPQTRYHPQGAGLISDPPLVPKPPVVINEVRDNYSLAEISLILETCRLAKLPKRPGISARDWWESVIIFGYNVGLRPESLLLIEWDWLYTDEHGTWVQVRPRSAKKKRGRAYFLNLHALAAIEVLRRTAPVRGPKIFGGDFHINTFHKWRREQLLNRSPLPVNRRLGMKGLRKAMITELSKINGTAAKIAAGHKGRDVTLDHYTNVVVYVEAAHKLPQPTKPTRIDPQRKLF